MKEKENEKMRNAHERKNEKMSNVKENLLNIKGAGAKTNSTNSQVQMTLHKHHLRIGWQNRAVRK